MRSRSRTVVVLFVLVVGASIATGCTNTMRPLGVRSDGASGVEVLVLACDEEPVALTLTRWDPYATGSGVAGSEARPDVVWNGTVAGDGAGFVVPVQLELDRRYRFVEERAGARNELTTFLATDLVTEVVIADPSGHRMNTRTTVETWREDAAAWCDATTGRWLWRPVLWLGAAALIGAAAVATVVLLRRRGPDGA